MAVSKAKRKTPKGARKAKKSKRTARGGPTRPPQKTR